MAHELQRPPASHLHSQPDPIDADAPQPEADALASWPTSSANLRKRSDETIAQVIQATQGNMSEAAVAWASAATPSTADSNKLLTPRAENTPDWR